MINDGCGGSFELSDTPWITRDVGDNRRALVVLNRDGFYEGQKISEFFLPSDAETSTSSSSSANTWNNSATDIELQWTVILRTSCKATFPVPYKPNDSWKV
uniref:Melibiase_C domain-containing protein n=1 Tax=Ascaris lumbricoides TaxID=6252 RepID=A0A0M3HW10_ASCLU